MNIMNYSNSICDIIVILIYKSKLIITITIETDLSLLTGRKTCVKENRCLCSALFLNIIFSYAV